MSDVRFLTHSHITWVIINYVLKFPNSRCHGNKDPSEIYFNDTVKLPDLKNPCLMQESRLYRVFHKKNTPFYFWL